VDEESEAHVLNATTHDEEPSDEHPDSIPAGAAPVRLTPDTTIRSASAGGPYQADSRLGARGGAPGAPARHVHSRISGRSSP
jgi:hypothetical protein